MDISYFRTAWTEVRQSEGWVGKMFLLGLVQFIPIFGSMVLYGYLFGWARELAWRVPAPMPKSIISNEDGKFYRRGFFALVIVFVFGLVSLIWSIASGYFSYTDTAGNVVWPALFAALIISLIVFVVECALDLFAWVGAMRMTLYNRLSAGFQLSKAWAMIKHDASGILRILGMNVLLMLIWSAIAAIALYASMLVLILFMFGGSALFGLVWFVWIIAVLYFALVANAFTWMMKANALGHWTAQFDVALWRGQDDLLPFEREQDQGQSQA